MTDEQAQEQYNKLKKIDKYAKTLGITIYNIEASFIVHDKEFHLKTPIFENKIPDKWKD